MTTYKEEELKFLTQRQCKPVKKGGCDMIKLLTDFPHSNRKDEYGKVSKVYGYWCKDCYNRRNRENAKKLEARRKACTREHDEAMLFNRFLLSP